MTFNKMESAGYLINHTARLFALGLREQISYLGIAPAQFMALLELWREDGLTQKELVERLDVEQATIANTISRMERDGLIERRTHPEDGRARTIHVTDRGKAIKSEATTAARTVNENILAPLTVKERQQFIETLQQIVRGMAVPPQKD